MATTALFLFISGITVLIEIISVELSVARMNGAGQVTLEACKEALNAARTMIYIFILILFPYLLYNVLLSMYVWNLEKTL